MSTVAELLAPTEAPTEMYPAHPLCKAFPRPEQDQIAGLKQHIKEVGLLKPMICWIDEKKKEWLIDGLTRNTVLDELIAEGVTVSDNGKPITKTIEWFEGDKGDVFEFVVGTNFNRREMSKSQRAALAVLFVDWEKKYKGRSSGNYAEKLAQQGGTNRQYIYDCQKIREKDLGLLEEVAAGTIKVKDALKKALGTPEAATDEGATAPEEPPVVLDGRKQEVEPEYREIFEARAEFTKAIKLIRQADQLMKDVKQSKGGKTVSDELFPDFRNLTKTIKGFMPHAVCPYCTGTGKNAETGTGRCPQCKGHKYLDAIQFAIVPEDLKGVVAGTDDKTEGE